MAKKQEWSEESGVLKAMMKRKEVGLCTEDARKSVEAGSNRLCGCFGKVPVTGLKKIAQR